MVAEFSDQSQRRGGSTAFNFASTQNGRGASPVEISGLDGSQLDGSSGILAARLDELVEGLQRLVGKSHLSECGTQVAPRLGCVEMFLDDLRERLSLALAALEELVGVQIDRDGFDCHALIMLLGCPRTQQECRF